MKKLSPLIFCVLFGLATQYFYSVGAKAHWTSDGPGILIIMILTGFFGTLTLAMLLGAAAAFIPVKESVEPREKKKIEVPKWVEDLLNVYFWIVIYGMLFRGQDQWAWVLVPVGYYLLIYVQKVKFPRYSWFVWPRNLIVGLGILSLLLRLFVRT